MPKKAAAKKSPKKEENPKPAEAAAEEAPEAPKPVERKEPGLLEVDGFLSRGLEMMASDATRALLGDPASGRPGERLIGLQLALWEDLGVDREAGRQAIDGAEASFPDEKERLAEAKKEFILRSQATYLQALADRRPAVLEDKEPMSKDAIREFCDACNAKASLPDTTDAMREKLEAGMHPDAVLLEMQMDMFETLGFEREHGKACLAKVGRDFPEDKQLHQAIHMITAQGSECVLIACNKHLLAGGAIPECDRKDALLIQVLQYRAKQQLAEMTPDERGALFERLQPKAIIFAKLPQEGRLRYLEKRPEEEKIETLKGELLLRQVVQSQQAQQHMAQLQAQQKAQEAKA